MTPSSVHSWSVGELTRMPERNIKAADRRITVLLGRVIDAPGDIPAEVLEEPRARVTSGTTPCWRLRWRTLWPDAASPPSPGQQQFPRWKTSGCGTAPPTPRRSPARTSGGKHRRCSSTRACRCATATSCERRTVGRGGVLRRRPVDAPSPPFAPQAPPLNYPGIPVS